MQDELMNESPDISGVPEEIQERIISDLDEMRSGVSSPVWKIGVSVSENEDLGILGYSKIHLRDLMIEIARHLLINNYILVYGGDLRKEGFTDLFSELAYQYRSIGDLRSDYFENYFSFPIYCKLTRQNELEFQKNKTKIVKVPPPNELGVDSSIYMPPSTIEQRAIWAKSLSHMRNQMILATNARIVVGGKCDNYLGALPGIFEEAKIALLQDKPLYLIGACGGASKQVIDAMLGNGFSFVDSDFHTSPEYQEFKSFYNSRSLVDKIDFEEDQRMLSGYTLERLAKNNGLSVSENLRLFQTPHLSEIIHYVFKGLKNILH